jgi:sodium-dependent dicarboxylate transporter 2/3/5
MFKNFHGFQLVESYHQKKGQRRFKLTGYLKALIAAILSVIIACLPTEWFGIEGLNAVEQRVIATFVFAALMWLSEAIPSWCTSVLIIVVMLFTISSASLSPFAGEVDASGVWSKYDNLIPYRDIMHCFADPTIMLFIGGFVLAIGLTKTQLDCVLAKYMLRPFGRKSENVLLGFILVTALFSAFVSNTATAAMMLAFLAPVLKALPADGKGRVALALAIPLGANIGGIATPIGTPPNTIVLGYLNETLGLQISFGTWMLKMVPYVLFLLLVGWFLLRTLFPFKQKTIDLVIEGEFKRDRSTWIVIATFITTVVLWCWPASIGSIDTSIGLNSYIIAFVPIAAFAATGILTKRDLEEINWSVLWMVAGGFALGVALNVTGLSRHLVAAIPFASWSPVLVMIISGLVCFGFSNFISHSAAASLLVPVLGVVAGAMKDAGTLDAGGVSTLLIGVAIAASVSMILPISTPPNAIAHSTGFIEQRDMMRVGIVMGVVGLIVGYLWLFLVF